MHQITIEEQITILETRIKELEKENSKLRQDTPIDYSGKTIQGVLRLTTDEINEIIRVAEILTNRFNMDTIKVLREICSYPISGNMKVAISFIYMTFYLSKVFQDGSLPSNRGGK